MSSRSFRYYAPSYLRLLKTFRNGLAIAYAHHNLSDVDRAVFWDGLSVRNAPNRSGLAETIVEIFAGEVYSAGGFYVPRSNDVVLDVGANVGLFAAWLARKAPGIRVSAFEPFAENFAALQENIKPWRNINAFPYAVGGRAGTASMVAVGDRSVDHRLGITATNGNVRVVTLEEAADLTDAGDIDFLKMDIEGSEYDVFEYSMPDQLMNRFRRIAIEWHEHIRPGVLGLLKERLSASHNIVQISADDERFGLLQAVRRN